MNLEAALSAVLNGLGIVGIVAFFVAVGWAIVDWLDEHRPRR